MTPYTSGEYRRGKCTACTGSCERQTTIIVVRVKGETGAEARERLNIAVAAWHARPLLHKRCEP